MPSVVSSIKFIATDADIIELTPQQAESLKSLTSSYSIIEDSSTPTFKANPAVSEELQKFINDRLYTLSEALDSDNPLKQLDDYNKLHSEWTKGKQDAADAAWVIKQREADSQAKLVGDTAVDDEYIRLDGIRQTNITAAENSAVANARTAAEDQAWTTRQRLLVKIVKMHKI